LKESVQYATQVKISLISNPYDYTDDLINNLLTNFFSTPRYLRSNDIFRINAQKYIPEIKYCAAVSKLKTLYFKVTNVYIKNKQTHSDGGFIIYDKTTLIQKANVNSYLPCKCLCDIPFHMEQNLLYKWPPIFAKSLDQLQSCIAPFMQKGTILKIQYLTC
jgi:hypothetical protein